MVCNRGDVLLIGYPFTDLGTVKVRPAVVLSGTAYHRQKNDMVLSALTSNIGGATSLDYVLHDWAEAGLRFPTAWKPALATLHPKLVVHSVGQMSRRDLDEIEKRLRLALEL